MNTFDGSGLGGSQPPQQFPPPQQQFPPQGGMAPVDVPQPADEIDSLGLLRQAVAQQVVIEPVTVEVPGNVGVRLVCHSEITSRQLQSWQNKALPPALRKSPNPPALAMDQLQLNVAVLANTMLRVEVRDSRDGGWVPVQDRAGNDLTFSDTVLLDQFGAMDTVTALKKLFVQEAEIVKAGQKVLAASGWSDREMVSPDEYDANPT